MTVSGTRENRKQILFLLYAFPGKSSFVHQFLWDTMSVGPCRARRTAEILG